MLLSGCGNDVRAPAASLTEVRDSAGITIVENGEPRLGPGAWTLGTEPKLVLGALDGEEPYRFSGPGVVAEYPDGRVAIRETLPPEIRIFDREGVHLQTVGRPGDGPGEFQAGPSVALAPPDTLITWDGLARRVSWFDGDGRLVREVSYADALEQAGVSAEVAPDGSVLVRDGEGGAAARHPMLFTAPDAPPVRFGEYPGTRRHPTGGDDGVRRWFSRPFGYHFSASLTGSDQVTVVGGPEWELRQFDRSGDLVRIIRAEVPREPVTEEMRDAAVADQVERMRTQPSVVEGAYEALGVPDSLPALGGVLPDDQGNLWVQRWKDDWRAASTWDVFDADGRWVTTIEVPAEIGFIGLIGRDRVYTTWFDQYDVPYIKVYELRRSER